MGTLGYFWLMMSLTIAWLTRLYWKTLVMNACHIQIQLNLQEFRPAYYDLNLLDIKMPILNAFELCKKILDNTSQIASITASKEYNENFRKKHYPELPDNVIYSKTNQ